MEKGILKYRKKQQEQSKEITFRKINRVKQNSNIYTKYKKLNHPLWELISNEDKIEIIDIHKNRFWAITDIHNLKEYNGNSIYELIEYLLDHSEKYKEYKSIIRNDIIEGLI
jgi:hypothetical protein